jgi:hypothetical protein
MHIPDITWTPPDPRPGAPGYWDRFVGPVQTRAELALTLVPSLTAAAAVSAAMAAGGFAALEVVLAAVLAFDIAGGVIANATTAGQRWYHRPGASPGEQLRFVALHGIHIALVGVVFLGGDWVFVAVTYVLLLASSVAALAVPLYLQRAVGRIGFMAGTAVGLGIFPLPLEMQWFVPVLFCKLLISHLTREAPWAP